MFVPEVLLAAKRDEGRHGSAAGPLLAETGIEPIGKMSRSAPSKGDIHDIGKNLVGTDDGRVLDFRGDRHRSSTTPVEKYLAAIEEHQPDILGMSALLTTTMPYMKVVIDTLKEKGLT